MRFLHLIFLVLLSFQISFAQPGAAASRPHCQDSAFDQKVNTTIDFSVPVMDVDQLKDLQEDVLILDARDDEEFKISHIEGAVRIGYDDFDAGDLQDIDKDEQIVIYCSIGYRSEKIAEKMHAQGFTNVFNLYGSIFEWVNRGYEVVDKDGSPTNKVHTYNLLWSKWVDGEKAEKVW